MAVLRLIQIVTELVCLVVAVLSLQIEHRNIGKEGNLYSIEMQHMPKDKQTLRTDSGSSILALDKVSDSSDFTSDDSTSLPSSFEHHNDMLDPDNETLTV
jgi:hypothetical protein